MQSKPRQNPLHDVLRTIAAQPDAEPCIALIVQIAQETVSATAARFQSFDDPDLSAGDPIDAGVDEKTADRLAPMSIDKATGLLLCPICDQNDLLGLLILETALVPKGVKRDLLAALIDALVIVLARERSQHALNQMRDIGDAVIVSLSDPLLVFDADWQLLMLNPAAGMIFDAETGQSLAEVVHSDELTAFARGEQALNEWIGRDKTFVPHVQAVGDDTTVGWILALRDITQYKKLNHNQAEFIRIVSHDIRSPLTSMRGFAEMMGMVGKLNEKQKGYSEKVQSGIAQITAIVDNIQDAGRFDPETGFYEMSRSHVDLREIVNRVVSNQLIPQDKSDLTVSVSVSDDVPIIHADKNMLERAITNLVDNAIKYTPNGGHIDALVAVRHSSVIVSVRDNGLGISPENQKLLFQRHVRLARPEHKRIKGTGLGLFIVKSVAQRHSGDAWVESVENVGSTFSFNIPLTGANLVISGSTGD